MKRSKSNGYYFTPVQAAWGLPSKLKPANPPRYERNPGQRPGLLPHIESGFIPPQIHQRREKTMDQDTVNNRLAAPLNFPALNAWSDATLAPPSFLPDENPAAAPEGALPFALPAAAVEERIPSPPAEPVHVHVVDVQDPPAQEPILAAGPARSDED
ncbi:MAG: hypothetical protein ACRD4Y_17690, partial [Candidatus Acidiferrales bacterium]